MDTGKFLSHLAHRPLSLIDLLDGHALLHRFLRQRNELLPHCGRDPQLRHRTIPPTDRTSLRSLCYHRIHQCLARRSDGRTILPHHAPSLYRRNRFHHCSDYHINSTEIFGYDVDASGNIHWYASTTLITPHLPAPTKLFLAGYVVALGWISNCMPRPPAKRAAALAAINAVSNTSSIYASYMFPSSAGPRYGKPKNALPSLFF